MDTSSLVIPLLTVGIGFIAVGFMWDREEEEDLLITFCPELRDGNLRLVGSAGGQIALSSPPLQSSI